MKKERTKPRCPIHLTTVVAVLLALAMLLGLTGCAVNGQPTSGTTIAKAQYSEMAQYPDETAWGFESAYDAWFEDKQARRAQSENCPALDAFCTATMQQFLASDDGENRAYSPISLYLALGMLAELTDGNSREQILNLLGESNVETLRAHASALWNANYCDDGAVTSLLASSLWLDQDEAFVQSTMDTLANSYYASSYQGEMGSEAFNKKLQDWLNEQTGNLLKEQASGVTMDPDTVLALATTIYFRAKWADEFSEKKTSPATFHGASGDTTCDFMHQTMESSYYWSEQFSAVSKGLEGSGSMWLILPDEGVAMDELLSNPEVMELVSTGWEWENSKFLQINLSLPKFDVSSDIDLSSGLQALGITDVFDPALADFTPMNGDGTTKDGEPIVLSQAKHAARVMVDEEGCLAAAYTVMMESVAAAPPDEEVDFVLDRPFLFVITSDSGHPLFLGVVNQVES